MQKPSNRSDPPRVVARGPLNAVLEVSAARSGRTYGEALAALQLLTVTDVCGLLRMSKPTLWRLRRAGTFPEPTIITERIFGWRQSQIDAWLAARPRSRKY